MLKTTWRMLAVIVMIVIVSSIDILTATVFTLQNGLSASSENTPDSARPANVNAPDSPVESLDYNTWGYDIIREDDDLNSTGELRDAAAWDEDSIQVIIGLNKTRFEAYNALASMAQRFGGKMLDTVSTKDERIAMIVDVPFNVFQTFREYVRNSGLARYLQPNMKVKALFTPNDPGWNQQWGPQKIQADWAWNTTLGNRSVLIAIVDTGVDYTHPDIAANYVTGGYDWINNDADPKDDYGHGTHCAGIAAAVINNSIGIAGLAQVRVMTEKVLDADGWGTYASVAQGIIHATDQGANVISMSLGGDADEAVCRDAVKYAYEHGVLIVASAGNDGSTFPNYPAYYEEVIAVSATDQNDALAYWSTRGNWIELAAPGVDIYSTMPTYHVTMNDYGFAMNYANMSGTSMACPHVTGLAALIWSRFPNATRDWVAVRLKTTTDDLGEPGFDINYGYGRINARKATESLPDHDLLIFDLKKPKYIQPGELVRYNFTVVNAGMEEEHNVSVQFLVNDTLMDSRLLENLENYNLSLVDFSWNPSTEGTYNITSRIVPVEGENTTTNNVITVITKVRWVTGFILFDESRSEEFSYYNTLVKNLTDNGYIVDTCMGPDPVWNRWLPITPELLAKYDVFVIPGTDLSGGTVYDQNEILAMRNFVRQGGALLVTGWNYWTTEWGISVYSAITGFAGIEWKSIFEYEGNITDITLHDMTEGAGRIYVSYACRLTLKSPAVELVRVSGDAVAISEVGDGKVACVGLPRLFEDNEIVMADNNIFSINIFDWLCSTPRREHDLAVSLNTQVNVEPNENVSIKATVLNKGLNNESNVNLQLFINNNLEANETIPELEKGKNHTLNCQWTVPNEQASYNVTAYAMPLPTEDFPVNNINTVLVNAGIPLFKPVEGQTANYTMHYYDAFWQPAGVGSWNFTFDHYYEPHKIYIIFQSCDEGQLSSSDWLIVDTMTGYVENGMWCYKWYAGWTTTNITIGSSVKIMSGTGVVNGSEKLILDGRVIDCWTANYSDTSYNYTYYYDKTSGLMTGILSDKTKVCAIERLLLSYTQIAIGTEHEHDLGVSLQSQWSVRPNETSFVNMTLHNLGQTLEAGVNLRIFINDTLVADETLAELAGGESYTITYAWTPTDNGTYNVNAYSEPLPGEEEVINNVATATPHARVAEVALIADGNQLLPLTPTLASMEVNYDICSFNVRHWYTKDLELLNKYPVIVFWSSWRNLTMEEYFIMENYLTQGGNLLVTSTGALHNDNTPLAKIVRSKSCGLSIYYGGDLYVADGAHPIMNGPFGSFPSGYDVTGLYQWCNNAEADEARGAVTVALVSPVGYDRIIATRNLPGKVVFWNGNLAYDVLYITEPRIMLKNMMHWFLHPVHDMNVSKIEFSGSVVQGDTANISVTAVNQGEFNENFTITLYANETGIFEANLTLQDGKSAVLTFDWNTTDVPAGDYRITASISPLAGEVDTADNILVGNFISVFAPVHDVAVASLKLSKTILGQGYSMTFNVTVRNVGNRPEMSDVTLLVNMTIIGSVENLTLNVGQTSTILCSWNSSGFEKGNYTISALIDTVLNETETQNNMLTGGTVLVGAPCDITGAEGVPDGVCNMRDIGYVCSKFMTRPCDPDWDANCDSTGYVSGVPDNIVNMRDIGEACNSFMKT